MFCRSLGDGHNCRRKHLQTQLSTTPERPSQVHRQDVLILCKPMCNEKLCQSGLKVVADWSQGGHFSFWVYHPFTLKPCFPVCYVCTWFLDDLRYLLHALEARWAFTSSVAGCFSFHISSWTEGRNQSEMMTLPKMAQIVTALQRCAFLFLIIRSLIRRGYDATSFVSTFTTSMLSVSPTAEKTLSLPQRTCFFKWCQVNTQPHWCLGFGTKTIQVHRSVGCLTL